MVGSAAVKASERRAEHILMEAGVLRTWSGYSNQKRSKITLLHKRGKNA